MTRVGAFVVGGGTYAYGSYPHIHDLFKQQAVQLNPRQRKETLAKIQQLVHERTVVAPIWPLAFINGVGPKVGESGLGLITDFAYTTPYEDITIKSA